MAKKKPASVTSRVNGLKIGIPPEARRVVERFRSRGDNELVFSLYKASEYRQAVSEAPVQFDDVDDDTSEVVEAPKAKTKGRRKKKDDDPVVD